MDRSGKSQHGGKRPGAGRPKGARNALPLGAVASIHSVHVAEARLARDNVAPELRQAVQHCVSRIADVLDERVNFQSAGTVLKAAGMLCDFVAGPQKQAVEHQGALSISVVDPYAAKPAPEGEGSGDGD